MDMSSLRGCSKRGHDGDVAPLVYLPQLLHSADEKLGVTRGFGIAETCAGDDQGLC